MHTVTAITIIAIIPPFDSVKEPVSRPAAPAVLSPVPGADPASPAAGPRTC